ncbi:MAG: hypothetical protein QNJ97_16305 [Myxococcota bacterium]|nr:hypothetical protein [Myxococcota bacterium]
MALDEPANEDEIYKDQGFEVVIDKSLLSELGGVVIDFQTSRWMGSGFSIIPTQRAAGACC